MNGYPVLDIFLSTMYFFGWLLWLMLMFWVVWDIFRSPDLSGWAKAGWLLLTIILPLVGVLIYLIARGSDMHERRATRAYYDDYRTGGGDVAHADEAGDVAHAEELSRLAGLHQRGVINDEEFLRMRTRIS